MSSQQPQSHTSSKVDKKPKGRGNKPFSKKSYPKPPRAKKPHENTRKVYKVAVRELPSSNFNEEDFKQCLNKFIEALGISMENTSFLHFIEGKLSRKRGPLSGAGFFCVDDEKAFVAICQASQHTTPFLSGESADTQPRFCIAPYQRKFKPKVRADKIANTIESDQDFLEFQASLKQPVEKLPSADLQYEAKEKVAAAAKASQDAFVKKETAKLKALANKREKNRSGSSNSRTDRAIRLAVAANLANKESADAVKKNPLLQFMKERGEKKRLQVKGTLASSSKKKPALKGREVDRDSDKGRDDKMKSKNIDKESLGAKSGKKSGTRNSKMKSNEEVNEEVKKKEKGKEKGKGKAENSGKDNKQTKTLLLKRPENAEPRPKDKISSSIKGESDEPSQKPSNSKNFQKGAKGEVKKSKKNSASNSENSADKFVDSSRKRESTIKKSGVSRNSEGIKARDKRTGVNQSRNERTESTAASSTGLHGSNVNAPTMQTFTPYNASSPPIQPHMLPGGQGHGYQNAYPVYPDSSMQFHPPAYDTNPSHFVGHNSTSQSYYPPQAEAHFQGYQHQPSNVNPNAPAFMPSRQWSNSNNINR